MRRRKHASCRGPSRGPAVRAPRLLAELLEARGRPPPHAPSSTLRAPCTQELERALKVQQQELRMREAALPALAEDVALLDDASQRLAERRA